MKIELIDADTQYLITLKDSYNKHKPVWRRGGLRYVTKITWLGGRDYSIEFSDVIKETWLTRLLKRLFK